jgi:hypothetical protein
MVRPIPASSILDALPGEVSRGLFAHGRSVSLEAEQTLFLAGDRWHCGACAAVRPIAASSKQYCCICKSIAVND